MADIAADDPGVLQDSPAQSIEEKLAFGSRRAKRIFNFENYHRQRDRWISFKRIVDWSKWEETPLGYEHLASAIHAGKFDHNGRSQILFMSPAAIESGYCGVARVNILPGCLRFSRSQFRQVHHPKQEQSVLEQAYLSRFWIPRAICERWFKSEGYDLPPWLDPPPSSKPAPGKKSATGKYLSVAKYLEKRFPGEIPDPAIEPRKHLINDAIAAIPQLGGKLDEETMAKAIRYRNARLIK
jgi:hypothetical protein